MLRAACAVPPISPACVPPALPARWWRPACTTARSRQPRSPPCNEPAATNRREAAGFPPACYPIAVAGRLPPRQTTISVWREGVLRLVALGDDFGRLRLAGDRARDRFLRGLIVEVLDLLVVRGIPMDEHADADEQVV